MKKILTILLVLIGVAGFGQQNMTIKKLLVTDSTIMQKGLYFSDTSYINGVKAAINANGAVNLGQLIASMDSVNAYDSLVFSITDGYLRGYKDGLVLDSTTFDGRYLTISNAIDSFQVVRDSLAIHLDTLQAHNTRMIVNVDSLAAHRADININLGKDTAGIFHLNRALLDAIDTNDTTWWGRAETDPIYAGDSATIAYLDQVNTFSQLQILQQSGYILDGSDTAVNANAVHDALTDGTFTASFDTAYFNTLISNLTGVSGITGILSAGYLNVAVDTNVIANSIVRQELGSTTTDSSYWQFDNFWLIADYSTYNNTYLFYGEDGYTYSGDRWDDVSIWYITFTINGVQSPAYKYTWNESCLGGCSVPSGTFNTNTTYLGSEQGLQISLLDANSNNIESLLQTFVANRDGVLIQADTTGGGGITGNNAIYINGDALPETDNVYSLGSATHRWKDLYLVNQTGTTTTMDTINTTIFVSDTITTTTLRSDTISTTVLVTDTISSNILVSDSITVTTLIIDTTIILDGMINITAPTVTGEASGNVTGSIQSGYTASTFDLVFLGSGGKWLEVDADTASTCQGMIAMALESKNDTQPMLVAIAGSFVKNTAWSWTVGATLYAGETLGSIQETIPTGANAVIRVIGFAVNATTIYFNPSSDQQTTVL